MARMDANTPKMTLMTQKSVLPIPLTLISQKTQSSNPYLRNQRYLREIQIIKE